MFGKRQTYWGTSQKPVVALQGGEKIKILKPIDKVSHGEVTRGHRAVTTVKANVASRVLCPRAGFATQGRRQHGVPKADRCGTFSSARWKRQACKHLLLLALLLASHAVARTAQATEGRGTVSRFEPAACPKLQGAEVLAGASCGYLVVPEDRRQRWLGVGRG